MPTGKQTKKKGGRGTRRKKKEESVEIACDEYKYNKNDVVLCYHGPQLYKAKILKRTIARSENDGDKIVPLYYVHYHGWNSQWDEWVENNRILPSTPINNELMMKQKKQNTSNKNKNKNKKNKNNKSNNNKKKRQIQDSEESDDDSSDHQQQNDDKKLTEKKDPESDYQEEDDDDDEHDEHEHDNDEADDEENNNKNKLKQLLTEKKKLRKDDLFDINIEHQIKAHHKEHTQMAQSPQMNEMDEKRNKFKAKLRSITLTTPLKDNLVQQWQLIHYDEKLMKIPKRNGLSINDILNDAQNDFENKMKNKHPSTTSVTAIVPDMDDQKIIELLPVVIIGIKGFFKNSIKMNLLYNFEKPQLNELLLKEKNNTMDLCSVYGAEHLIRLFFTLPNILFHTKGLNEENFGEIKQCITILIHYLSKNKNKYLSDLTNDDFIECVDDAYLSKVKKIQKQYDDE